jgi:hypothetical protein
VQHATRPITLPLPVTDRDGPAHQATGAHLSRQPRSGINPIMEWENMEWWQKILVSPLCALAAFVWLLCAVSWLILPAGGIYWLVTGHF